MTESWMQVIAVVGSNLLIVLTVFGATISLYLSTKKDINAIHCEMKDFHGRLEKQDAEFKSHMKYANHGTRKGE